MIKRLQRLLFQPASPIPLAALRIALAAILLGQAAFLVRDLLQLYEPNGLLQGALRRFILAPLLPVYVDWAALGSLLGTAPESLINGLFLVYVGSLSLLLVGLYSRTACVVAWLTNFLIKLNLGYTSSYGVDTFTHIFLFYLMFMPMNRALSLDRLLGRTHGDAGQWQRVSLRILQLHLFLIYCSTGIEKALGWQWRTGEVIWRAWMLPQFAVFDMSWLAWHSWLATLIAWSTLVLEIGYPVLVGNPRTRALAGLGIVGMHLGIAITMGLWSFSLVMIALTSCAFLVSADPGQPGPVSRLFAAGRAYAGVAARAARRPSLARNPG